MSVGENLSGPEPSWRPTADRPPPRLLKPGWRKAGRALIAVTLALAAVLTVAIVGALVWLHTGNGSEQLGRFLTQEAGNAIQGSLKVRALHVTGFIRICADGVELHDPDGNRTIAADRVCVKLNPLALKAKQLRVSEAVLETPWIEIATVQGPDGKPATTLSRALAPKKPKPTETNKQSGTFDWVIDVKNLVIHHAAVAIRPGVGEPATFAFDSFELGQAHARYAQNGAEAGLRISAQLKAPGEDPVVVDLDAKLDGEVATGAATIRALRVKVGESGFAAQGSYDLGRSRGEIHLREVAVEPQDVRALLHKPLLSGRVRGEADVKAEPKGIELDARLQAGGGKIGIKAGASIGLKVPEWKVQLALENVDPGSISPQAPRGQVTAKFEGSGKGVPRFDEHGVVGELKLALHVGPANLDRVGPLVSDLEADIAGRFAIVRSFSATALGLEVKARGAAARDELSLDVEIKAPALSHVGRAVGAITRKPALPVAGTAVLTARVTGSPKRPDAQVHLRAPWMRWGPTVAADGLAVDGVLHGDLSHPDGQLVVVGRKIKLGNIDVGAPRIDMGLEWPIAHLRIDAGVKNGQLQLAGDATIDDDKDGLVLSNFSVAWPENQMRLAEASRVHFRDEVIVEPLNLESPHGNLRLSAQWRPATPQRPGTVDAAAVLSRFDLAFLPRFVLPAGNEPKGIVDANAVVQGRLPHPDVDVRLDLDGGGLRRLEQLAADAHLHAHVHGGRLRADGWLDAKQVGKLKFEGDVPLPTATGAPANVPLGFEAEVAGLDLHQLAERAQLAGAQRAELEGKIALRLIASGTLAAPRSTLAVDAQDIKTKTAKGIGAHAGVLLENGKVAFDAEVDLSGSRVLGVTAQHPFDLARALRDPAYLRGAMARPLSLELAVNSLEVSKLVEAGLMPQGSAGTVSVGLRVGGTPRQPTVNLSATGKGVTVGKLHQLDVQALLAVGSDVRLTASAESQGLVVVHADVQAAVSGGELVELAASRKDASYLEPLLDRALSVTLDVPGLPIARASQLAGSQKVAEGRIVGHASLGGTPARPSLTARIALSDVTAQDRKLGGADVYLEADGNGGRLHLGIDPPGGGNFLGHAEVQANLGARALLRGGAASLLDSPMTGTMRAQRLDLGFLGGVVPNVRRAAGTLDGQVALAGKVGKPTADGDAHLRGALFDVVGQGVFHDIGLDAKFSPKEVVLDRLTGSSGQGTFSAILVASRRPTTDTPDKVEFTGEIHVGDDESARDRKSADGKPLPARPVSIRTAGEPRVDLTAELDLFGDFTDGTLTLNTKIPDARVKVLALPNKKLPSLKENPDVILVHPGERPHPPGREPGDVEAEAAARKSSNFRLAAHLQLNHLYVQAPDFEFPVQSDMRFVYDARDPDHPSADGTIHVPQGSFSALGRRFTIEDAKIIETGGEIDNPDLEIKARYENPKAVVDIVVTGTAKAPEIQMTSNPPMDQDAIAFFLATGRIDGRATQSGGGVDLSSAATSVLGGLLFGEVRKQLADVLPVDVITIETGDKGVSQASVGKYIGDRVFIGYRARLTPAPGENTNEGRIEYEISKSVSFEATIGELNRDVSLMWTRDF